MKKLCLVLYIFGDKYQEYIPLFAWSLFKLYPDYGIRVYLDTKLNQHIKNQVEILKDKDLTIIENHLDNLEMTDKAKKVDLIQRSQRWLFYDEAFENYEAVYMGDADIIFCPEKEKMFEAHIKHCEIIGKPYSNIARKPIVRKNYSPKVIARNFIKFGIKDSFKYYFGHTKPIRKLTGLHFVRTKEYYSAVRPVMREYVKELNKLAEHKSKKYNLCSFNDEAVLYDMVNDCGFGTPEVIGSGLSGLYNICESGEKMEYRPHHGIHLGIFRNEKTPFKEWNVVTSDLYRGYYEYFKELEKTGQYKSFEKGFSPYMRNIIDNMNKFYLNHPQENMK
ncbi:MAG: hypothetical protein Q8873_08130 [Bacillota bacterium]|nr:hypothetical protein [Bacillota bacterium]